MNFEMLRLRWKASLTGGAADRGDPHVQSKQEALWAQALDLWRAMNRETPRSCIWTELSDPGNPYIRDRVCLSTFRRLEIMARAWCIRDTLPDGFLRELLEALEFLNRNWYNLWDRKGGEWWHREIGIPLCLTNCIVLLYEELDASVRDNCLRVVESYVNPPDRMCLEDIPEDSTGANRAWKCLALAQCAILKEDEELLFIASEKIRDVFRYTQQGDGFYRDGSFIQHRKFAYTGGYGVSFLETIVSYMELTRDTPWQIREEERNILLDWVMHAYVPMICRGGFMSMARGREIARQESQEHEIGHQVIAALLKLSKALPREAARKLKGRLKYWIMTDSFRDYLTNAPLEAVAEGKKLLEDSEIQAEGPERECRIYAAMDKVVHHRGSFAAAISMCSKRTGRYESIHNENVRGWYTSEGMLYLYNSDLGQFSDDYFPTVNACRMPGTTVDTLAREAVGVGFGKEPPIPTTWAGGACLNGQYGAVGMELEGECSDLRARKSWFLFDDEIVCLGAGITATQGRDIETIVENRKIHKPMSQILRADAQWVHLQGPCPGSDMGYWFPQKQNLEITEEVRTGSWDQINRLSGSTETVSNRFVNLIIHHGINPENGGYAYVLLPGKSEKATAAFAETPAVEIIANTKRLQAVRHQGLNITALNIWEDGSGCSAGIRCDRRAALLVREQAGILALSAADPTWENEDGITVELDRKALEVVRRDARIQVLQLEPTVKLQILTGNARGKSMEIVIRI